MSHDFSKWRMGLATAQQQPRAQMTAQQTRCPAPAPQKPAEAPQTLTDATPVPDRYDYSKDILGCVYAYVHAHAHGPELPQLTESQIVRSWHDAAMAPPDSEYCVLTHLSSIRHGTNVHEYEAPEGDTQTGLIHMYKSIEHTVQVDFFCTLQNGQDNARRRATILELVFNSTNSDSYLKSYNQNFSALYADDVTSFNEIDETNGNRQRHCVTLHIGETVHHAMPQQYFDAVDLHTRPIDGLNKNEV